MPTRTRIGDTARWYPWMQAIATDAPAGVAARIATSASDTTAPRLEARRVLAYSGNHAPVAVQCADNRKHVEPEHAGPQEHKPEQGDASDSERDQREHAH